MFRCSLLALFFSHLISLHTSSPVDLLLLNFSHLNQSAVPKRHVSKQRSGETKSWQSLGICPASSFHLLIYSFVCVPPPRPPFWFWCVSNCPPWPARQHTHKHTKSLIATWRSVKLQPHQHCCEGITVYTACCLLSSLSLTLLALPPSPLSPLIFFSTVSHALLSPVVFYFTITYISIFMFVLSLRAWFLLLSPLTCYSLGLLGPSHLLCVFFLQFLRHLFYLVSAKASLLL